MSDVWKLDKQQTSHHDILDSFRLALCNYELPKKCIIISGFNRGFLKRSICCLAIFQPGTQHIARDAKGSSSNDAIERVLLCLSIFALYGGSLGCRKPL